MFLWKIQSIGEKIEDQALQPTISTLSGMEPIAVSSRPPRNRGDIHPDGQRFLIAKNEQAGETPTDLILVQNWFEELKRLVPTE